MLLILPTISTETGLCCPMVSVPIWFGNILHLLTDWIVGHTCLFQYCFLHLTGYKAMTFEQLQSYHSMRIDAQCPGHPEIENEGIEVTTGPLGQGVANAVGLAMATKSLGAQFNRPGFEVVNNHTWCMIGDACLQEGIALEAISFAGHLKLNNLTIMYDNNQVTCDGSVDLTNTEDVNAKMRASGWNVISVEDGSFDIEGIVQALQTARSSTDKPTFINIKTVIGLDTNVAGQAVAHGAAFGKPSVAALKKSYSFNPEADFYIPDGTREFFKDIPARGEVYVQDWKSLVEKYSVAHPELAVEFRSRMRGEIPDNWEQLIPKSFPDKATASRASSGLVLNPLAKDIKSFMVGTADLSPSVYMAWPGMVDFQHVSSQP
jgi:dihydroxyacetone synthase